MAEALHQSGFSQLIQKLKKQADRVIFGELVLNQMGNLQRQFADAGLRLTNKDLAAVMRKTVQNRTSGNGRKYTEMLYENTSVLRGDKPGPGLYQSRGG